MAAQRGHRSAGLQGSLTQVSLSNITGCHLLLGILLAAATLVNLFFIRTSVWNLISVQPFMAFGNLGSWCLQHNKPKSRPVGLIVRAGLHSDEMQNDLSTWFYYSDQTLLFPSYRCTVQCVKNKPIPQRKIRKSCCWWPILHPAALGLTNVFACSSKISI